MHNTSYARIILFGLAAVIFASISIYVFTNNKSYDEYYNDGMVYYKEGDYDNAISSFSKAIQKDSERSQAYEWRALAFVNQNKYRDAIADFDRASLLNPGMDPEYHYNRGLAYYGLGMYDNAIEDYDKILAAKPTHALAYYKRGNAYRSKNMLDLAKSDFQKCVELSQTTDLNLLSRCKDAQAAITLTP